MTMKSTSAAPTLTMVAVLLMLTGCGGEIASARDGGAAEDGAAAADAAVRGDASPSDSAFGTGDATAPGDGGSDTDGATGIAAAYPGDDGIAAHPDVIFADDFESYGSASDLDSRWDVVDHLAQLRIATEAGSTYAGTKAVEMTLPQQDSELSNALDKVVAPELDALYLRYYSKFAASFDIVGSCHNGSMISAGYFVDGIATPGIPADGYNKYLTNLETWRGEAEETSPGALNIYIYHPDQRSQWGDHFFPTGTVLPYSSTPYDFGPEFVSRPDLTPELDRWYCYEHLLKANTPGERDGRITVWVDGQLVADFPNLSFREIDSLKIDRFGLSFHAGSNTAGETHKYYDNVVAATSYVGPLAPP